MTRRSGRLAALTVGLRARRAGAAAVIGLLALAGYLPFDAGAPWAGRALVLALWGAAGIGGWRLLRSAKAATEKQVAGPDAYKEFRERVWQEKRTQVPELRRQAATDRYLMQPQDVRKASLLLAGAIAACSGGSSPQSSATPTTTYRNVSPAMLPTLAQGQEVRVLLFEDSAAVLRDVRRTDIVAYKWPIDTSRKWIKRVAGLPGDTLAMRGGTLMLNGAVQPEPYAVRADTIPLKPVPEIEEVAGKLPGRRAPDRDNWGPLVVPPGAYFLLGDNRAQSLDSRYWGFVPASHILGRAIPQDRSR